MGYTTVFKEVEVDVDMDDFEDQDLIDEIEKRGLNVESPEELKRVTQGLYDIFTANKIFHIPQEIRADGVIVEVNEQFDRHLCRLFDIVLGRIA